MAWGSGLSDPEADMDAWNLLFLGSPVPAQSPSGHVPNPSLGQCDRTLARTRGGSIEPGRQSPSQTIDSVGADSYTERTLVLLLYVFLWHPPFV